MSNNTVAADIIEYKIVSSDEINLLLQQGYRLYGSPISHHDQIFQAVTKSSLRTRPEKNLNETQAKCVLAYAEGMTYREIAKKLNKSTNTINDLFAKLRKQFSCRNNTSLAVYLLKNAYISDKN